MNFIPALYFDSSIKNQKLNLITDEPGIVHNYINERIYYYSFLYNKTK